MNKYFSKVWYILKGSRKDLPVLLLVFVLSSLLEALGIGLVGPFFNLASNPYSLRNIGLLNWIYTLSGFQSPQQFVLALGLLVACVFCVKSCLYFLSQRYIFSFTFIQRGQIAARLHDAYLSAPYTFYLKRNTASIIKNILFETQEFSGRCMLPLLNVTANIFVIVALLLLLAKTDSFLLMSILCIILPIYWIFTRFKEKLKEWGRESSESNEEIIRVINHSLGGLKETRVVGCEPYFRGQMKHQVGRFAKAATSANSLLMLPRIVLEAAIVVFLILFISISQLILPDDPQKLTAVLAVFTVAALRLLPTISQFIQGVNQLQSSSHTVDILYQDLKEIENQSIANQLISESYSTRDILLTSKQSQKDTIPFTNQIKILDITYRYPEVATASLNHISLTLKRGESIALIGKSGAGKTTLVDVILGLLMPEQGDISVDGKSIYSNIRAWQNIVGYIPQSIFLIDDTIERNIAFGVPDHAIDQRSLEQAIKAAQLEELIQDLPDGIKTIIGERGVRLSGGQRQRIGIARALYHEREVLVLDEATSALDNETESLVTQAIRSLSGHKTMIIIAHRLSTVEHCDRIYLLNKGQILKSGNYQEIVLKEESA
jgi:ATP-binding cassette, subfamily B, bacterial PglK